MADFERLMRCKILGLRGDRDPTSSKITAGKVILVIKRRQSYFVGVRPDTARGCLTEWT
ncbi:hypothetical protein QWZ10_20405 [Paracoccus cavernae]|uniref:Uncharacterized protein n=1 Tax=Paracoccus cavernae TaxID=1571207 RepID=A0ABT8DC67_9RHOB|nr:hypothetical protein [Paracoccus cavernae]